MGVTKRKSSSAEAAGEQPRVPKRTWITPEQYKGIGRYLKPWGKPPTKFTFWCQIITTLVVIIISIGKALESLRDPTFLAFAIVGLLFGALLLFGYVKAKRQQNRERAEEEAQALREAEAEAAANKAMGRLGRTTKQDDDDDDDDDDDEAAQARARARPELRGLQLSSELLSGTRLRTRPGPEVDEYVHWTFPEDDPAMAEPSYMMARRLRPRSERAAAPAPAPAARAAGEKPVPAPEWWAHCLAQEGVLTQGPTVQVGFKTEVRAHTARIGLYYGNLEPSAAVALSACSVQSGPGTQGALLLSVAPPPTALPPRGQALQMMQVELLAPFVEAPELTIAFSEPRSGKVTSLTLTLPILPLRFLRPWTLGADDYFRWWRAPNSQEKQANFQLRGAYDAAAVRKLLCEGLRIAVLDGIDPLPTNTCAAAVLCLKSGVLPPAPGAVYCLVRLEVNPNHARTAAGTPRAAARLTVRGSHQPLCESVVRALVATLGGGAPG